MKDFSSGTEYGVKRNCWLDARESTLGVEDRFRTCRPEQLELKAQGAYTANKKTKQEEFLNVFLLLLSHILSIK